MLSRECDIWNGSCKRRHSTLGSGFKTERPPSNTRGMAIFYTAFYRCLRRNRRPRIQGYASRHLFRERTTQAFDRLECEEKTLPAEKCSERFRSDQPWKPANGGGNALSLDCSCGNAKIRSPSQCTKLTKRDTSKAIFLRNKISLKEQLQTQFCTISHLESEQVELQSSVTRTTSENQELRKALQELQRRYLDYRKRKLRETCNRKRDITADSHKDKTATHTVKTTPVLGGHVFGTVKWFSVRNGYGFISHVYMNATRIDSGS